jgi:hypothetical protein
MIRHIVLWRFLPGTEAQQEEFLTRLRGLEGVLPQIVRLDARHTVGGSCDAALVADFRSREDLAAYQNDPRHKAVSALCKAIRTDRISADLEI